MLLKSEFVKLALRERAAAKLASFGLRGSRVLKTRDPLRENRVFNTRDSTKNTPSFQTYNINRTRVL